MKTQLRVLLALGPLAACGPALGQTTTTISNLPAATAPLADTEIAPIVQSSATKKATVAQIKVAYQGTSAPTSPILGQFWFDTTTTPALVLKQYDGASWVTIGTLNTSAHTWTPAGGAGGVSSFNTRTGAVTPQTGDYTFAQIGSPPTTVAGYGITDAATLTGSQTLTNKTLTAPVMTAPVLGTPASGTLTNAIGLPIATGVSGLGTGVAAALGTNASGTGAICLASGSACGGGSGTVTNVATGACLTGGPVTTTGTISGTYANRTASGTTDTIPSTDACGIVNYTNSGSVAVTVPQATGTFGNGFSFDVKNANTGTVTLTPTTSTINGAASLAMPGKTSCTIWSDGTNWNVIACTALSARLANSQTFTGEQRNCITTLTAVSNVFTPDGSCNNYKLVLGATNTIANFTAMNPGAAGVIEADQDATGSRTVGTWGSQIISPGGTSTIALSTAANAKDFISYLVLDSTHVLFVVGGLNASH